MRIAFAIAISCILAAPAGAWQEKQEELPFLNFLQQLGPVGGAGGDGNDLKLSGEFKIAEGSQEGRLSITAKLTPSWHVYSITQQPGATQKSELRVEPSDQFQLLGPFQADVPPKIKTVEFYDVPIEEHSGTVTWTAPLRIAEGVDPRGLQIKVTYTGQLCQDEGVCIQIDRPVQVRFAGNFEPPKPTGQYRSEKSHATLKGHVEPSVVRPGATITLSLTAETEPDWHVYAYAPQAADQDYTPTLIALTTSGWSAGLVKSSVAPVKTVEADMALEYYEGPVTWTVPVKVPEDAAPGQLRLSGIIGYQTCTDSTCDMPVAAQFTAAVTVAESNGSESQLLAFEPAEYSLATNLVQSQSAGSAAAGSAVAAAAAGGLDLSKLEVEDGAKSLSVGLAVLIAFAGGFVLNFMPCVLPVIGLKIMAFVEQSGHSRGRAFALNVWYALGLLSVFMVLATLAVVFNLGWGQQNQSVAFNVTMAAVVFAMGLSFLGVWEIPIPGFVGSGKASEVAEQEGVAGAFAKGIITTILAVPCSGPLVAPALAWSAGQSAPFIYLTFAVMGLGMASPYLVIGAFPHLVHFLPRPGAWMETFKQVMGFVLLGTVIWIFSYLDWTRMLPTLMFLFGLWAACWWVGRIPVTADSGVKLRAWATAAGFAALIGMLAFNWLTGVMEERFASAVERRIAQYVDTAADGGATVEAAENSAHALPWRPFSLETLERLSGEGKTVMVDFTADWCPNCKVLENTVLNTDPVKRFVDENQVVPLLADWTDPNPEISQMLELLGSKQIPVLAIFPAGRPNQPIVLRGGYTRKTLLSKLAEAGPSQDIAGPGEPRDAKVLAQRP